MGLGGDRQEMQNWGGGKGGINIFLQNGILNSPFFWGGGGAYSKGELGTRKFSVGKLRLTLP